jgi:uncharacterized protein (DUF2236 family)
MDRSSPVLGALDPGAPAPFGRNSIVRAVVAQPATALLVQRALVMEVAHPAVAAAVDHHSHFQRHPLSRAWVTTDAAVRLVFGDDHVARGAARQIYGVHDHINGPLVGPIGPNGPGGEGDEDGGDTRYTAHDASLLAWVWATLVDTAETAFTRWVRPFDADEGEAFYREMRLFARFFGIPDELLPADRETFACYLEDMLAGEFLGASTESRALARQVLWFRHRSVPAPLVRVERVLALATLDRRVVERLGIRPEAADLDLGRRTDAWMTAHYRRLPRAPVILPALYVLMRRPSIGLAGRIRTALGRS